MAKITTKAYIPSVKEYETLKGKYPAFAIKRPNEKALIAGVFKGANWDQQCSFLLRTANEKLIPTAKDSVMVGHLTGTLDSVYSNNAETGLVVAISVIYDPTSDVVRSCRTQGQDSLISIRGKQEWIASDAPVVEFGGIRYVWLNKEECENGTCQVMSLISVDVLDKALPVSHDGSHSDFTKADTLHAQCEITAFENATDEEMEMVVPVEISNEDGCEKLTYKFTEKQREILKKNQSAEIEKAM